MGSPYGLFLFPILRAGQDKKYNGNNNEADE